MKLVSFINPDSTEKSHAAAAAAVERAKAKKAASPEPAANPDTAQNTEGGKKKHSGGKLKTVAQKAVKTVKQAAEKVATAAKAIVKPSEKAAAVLEIMNNPKIIHFSNREQLSRFRIDVLNEKICCPLFVLNEKGEREIRNESGDRVTLLDGVREIVIFQYFHNRDGVQDYDSRTDTQDRIDLLYKTFPILDLTGVKKSRVNSELESTSWGYLFSVANAGGSFSLEKHEKVLPLYGEDYDSYEIVIQGEIAITFLTEYRDYKNKTSATYNMSVQERKEWAKKQHGYISINSESDSETEKAAESSGKSSLDNYVISWNKLQKSNKKWKSITDASTYYCDCYNRLGQPIDLKKEGLVTITDCYRTGEKSIGKIFSDCVLGTKMYPEREDSPIIYDKNDPCFVAALYGVAYAQASSVLKFCRDPQRSGKDSKGNLLDYAIYKGMYIPSNSGYNPVMLQLGSDIQAAAYELTHESWANLNAYAYKTNNGEWLFDSEGKLIKKVRNQAAANYFEREIADVARPDAITIGDGFDTVQQAAMEIWERSLAAGGRAYADSVQQAIADGKEIDNMELLTKEQREKVPERYKDDSRPRCFLNQWQARIEYPENAITDDLTKPPEGKEIVSNPMRDGFRAARQVVQKNRSNQIASGKYSYIEMFIFNDSEGEIETWESFLFRCGKYCDLGGFSTESGKFSFRENGGGVNYDNGKNFYSIDDYLIEDITKKVKKLGLSDIQKYVLRHRFNGESYDKIAAGLGAADGKKRDKSTVRDHCKAIQKKWIREYGEPENLWKYNTYLSDDVAETRLDSKGNKVYTTSYFINGVAKKRRGPKQSANKSYTQVQEEKLAAQRAAWAAEKEYKAQQAAAIKCTLTGEPKKLTPTGIHDPAAYKWYNPITGKLQEKDTTKPAAIVAGNEWAASVIAVNNPGSRNVAAVLTGDDSNRDVYNFLKKESYLQL